MKKKLDQEVAYVQRLERKMSQHLQKKKVQLRYTKQVSNRFQSDIQRVLISLCRENGLINLRARQ